MKPVRAPARGHGWSRTFRPLRGAAPLKQGYAELTRPLLASFRPLRGAAPLKPSWSA